MKKSVWIIWFLIIICVFALSACDINDIPMFNKNNGKDDSSSDMTEECQHSFGDWETIKESTCKEEGKRIRTCSKCSDTEEEAIKKSYKHTEVIDAAIPATCNNTGLTQGIHCSVCDKVILMQTSVPKTNDHKFVRSETNTSYQCSLCKLNVIEHGNADGSLAGGNNRVKYYVTGDWENYNNFEIVIYGNGDMPNFSQTNLPMWYEYLNKAVKITIEDGITSIGNYAFYCPDSTTSCNFVMSDTVKTINSNAIYLKTNNLVLGNGVETVEIGGIAGMKSIYIPKSVKRLFIGVLGNETYFYEGSLDEFYQIQLYVNNQATSVKDFLEVVDESFISNIHIYVHAKNIFDRSNYWR